MPNRFSRIVLHLAMLAALAPASVSIGQAVPESCPPGLFRDLSREPHECRYLDRPFWGPEVSILDRDSTLTVDDCTQPDIVGALEDLAQEGGGTLRLPACTVEISAPLFLPSNVALVGSGIGDTILRAAPTHTRPLLRVYRSTNVRISDVSFDGVDQVDHNLEIRYSSHVLVERSEFKRVRQNGLVFYQSRNVAIRNNYIHDIDVLYSNNGLGAKDCYPDRGDVTLAECIESLDSQARSDFSASPECPTSYCACDLSELGEGPGYCYGYGSRFTTFYLVHSNDIERIANDYCLALHARSGEVAGNRCRNSKHGMKTPDARDVFIHDNLFADNSGWGYFAYGPVKDNQPRRIRLYNNRLIRHGDVAIRMEGPDSLYLVNNEYTDNCRLMSTGYCNLDLNYIINNVEIFNDPLNTRNEPTTFICPGFSTEQQLFNRDAIGPYDPFFADRGTCYDILPIEFEHIAVRQAGDLILVQWRTSGTDAAGRLDVEESRRIWSDGAPIWGPWQPLDDSRYAERPTKTGGGTLRLFVGDHGRFRYRLRATDLSGALSYSPSVEVDVLGVGGLNLSAFYPNPFSTTATARLVSPVDRPVRVELFDAMGHRLQTLFAGLVQAGVAYEIHVASPALAPGPLFVRADDGRTTVQRRVVLVR